MNGDIHSFKAIGGGGGGIFTCLACMKEIPDLNQTHFKIRAGAWSVGGVRGSLMQKQCATRRGREAAELKQLWGPRNCLKFDTSKPLENAWLM